MMTIIIISIQIIQIIIIITMAILFFLVTNQWPTKCEIMNSTKKQNDNQNENCQPKNQNWKKTRQQKKMMIRNFSSFVYTHTHTHKRIWKKIIKYKQIETLYNKQSTVLCWFDCFFFFCYQKVIYIYNDDDSL